MFSITLINIDSYQASPIPELDVTFSEFRGSEVKKVPVIRIFGSTATGKKTCLHVHGVFPYLYVPCTVQENTDSFAYRLAASIDSALNTSFGCTLSTNQHVYKIQRVSGIPFYGYHNKKHLFFKIYLYNPAIIKRTADLLQNDIILNQHFQPYEAHIPYILQFMIDYNLYGMNLINLNNIKYRHSLQRCTTAESQSKSLTDMLDSQIYLPISVARQSMCELEVDTHASDILNRRSITDKMELNPGLAGIWEEERARRAAVGLENAKSQLLYPKTPSKIILPPTSNDIYQEGRLLKRLIAISQSDETISSDTNVSSYPIEVEDDEPVLNASHVLSHELPISEENIERTVSDDNQLLRSNSYLEANRSQNSVTDSFLDADDLQLVEMLADLAGENEIANDVDNDSVLGSQYSMLSEPAKNDQEEEEEEAEDLNITSLDLGSVGSWELAHKRSDQCDNAAKAEHDVNNRASPDVSSEDIALTDLPQLDGVDDLCGSASDHEEEIISRPDDATCRTAIPHSSTGTKHDSCEKFTLPSVDGATASDPSDSEDEVDVTVDRREERVCVFKSGRKNTPGKRKRDDDDDSESPDKRRNTDAKTPGRRAFYNSPSKAHRSPSRNYSPLDITITSPRTGRSPVEQCESPKRRQCMPTSDVPSTSKTPKRNTQLLRLSLLREKRTGLPNSENSENNVSTDNVREDPVINMTDTVRAADDANTQASGRKTREPEGDREDRRARGGGDPLIPGSTLVRKRLYFSSNDEVENTVTGSEGQPRSSIALGRLVDEADATIFSSGNDEDTLVSSQHTQISNDTTSPERGDASGISNARKRFGRHLVNDVIPETDEDEDACDTTFTQHVSQKTRSQTPSSSRRSARSSSDRRALITITTKHRPPDPGRIAESMESYGIPRCRAERPFFGDKVDLARHRESASTSSFDVPAFKSSLEDVTGIGRWRRMKVNEFHPSGASIKTCRLKQTLAGYGLLTIRPLAAPPSVRDVGNWVKAKEYLSKKADAAKSCGRRAQEGKAGDAPPNVTVTNDESRPGTSRELPSMSDTSAVERSVSLLSGTSDDSRRFEFTQSSNNSQDSGSALMNPSLRKALENPLLYKPNETEQRFSYGQIEHSSGRSYGNVSAENLQNARAVAAHQYLTLMSLEVHVVTREDLLPNPQYDSIAALFYAIHNDIPTDASALIEHAAVIVNPHPVSARLNRIHSASAMCSISYVATEQDAFDNLVKLMEQYNPDILVGWEVEALSWGYVFQRAFHLALYGFPWKISKVPYVQIPSGKPDASHTLEKDEIKVPGRIILDVWRIMRHEADTGRSTSVRGH